MLALRLDISSEVGSGCVHNLLRSLRCCICDTPLLSSSTLVDLCDVPSLIMISPQGRLRSFRSSTAFITFVIAYAVFTDQFIFAAVIPVYPYSLQNRVHVAKENVQFWVAILLATFGIACVVTAGMLLPFNLIEHFTY